jgi:hypothetical protein
METGECRLKTSIKSTVTVLSYLATNQGGWGFIIRNHTVHVIVAGAGAADSLINAQHAENAGVPEWP